MIKKRHFETTVALCKSFVEFVCDIVCVFVLAVGVFVAVRIVIFRVVISDIGDNMNRRTTGMPSGHCGVNYPKIQVVLNINLNIRLTATAVQRPTLQRRSDNTVHQCYTILHHHRAPSRI